MARPLPDQALLASVLDRLIDHQPEVPVGPSASQPSYPVRIKGSVKRDLEWLLNSRQSVLELPDDLHHLARSLLAYGVPDFTTFCLSNGPDRDRLRLSLTVAIGRFEPRLTGIVVTLAEGRASDRTLRFRIDGVLRVEPAPEPVRFDSVLRLDTGAFVVQAD
jgi:type VI secretion system protein ImpF